MKKSVLIVVLLLLVSMIFTSCGTLFTKGGSDYRSGVSAYEKREYASSLRYLSRALAVNPEFVEAAQLFPVVFREGTAYYKTQIANNVAREGRQAADTVFHAYTDLQDLHDIARFSGRSGLFTEDFTDELREARLKSGNLWYAYAQTLQARGDREHLKQAVVAYETARSRNPHFENIDSLIASLIKEVTVTVAVAAYGPSDKNFSRTVLDDVTRTLSSNRFVEVIQRYDFSPGVGSMVGPLDIAVMEGRAKGWDYVLEVYAFQGFEEIDKESRVRLPSEAPLFNGVKRTIGYQHNTTVSYRLFDIKHYVSVVAEDRFSEIDGPYEYSFSYVPAEGVRELNLGGTGKKNLRYVTSWTDDVTTDSAISLLRQDYERISIPIQITDPIDQTQWISYFANTYDDFEEFARKERGRELFYGIEVVHHSPSDTYFIIGETLDAAIERSRINSAIMNALSYTARTLIDKEEKQGGLAYRDAGEFAAKGIRNLL